MKNNRIKLFLFPLFGAKDDGDKLKSVIKSLGMDLEKIEKGELSVDDAIKMHIEKTEKAVSERIAKDVEVAEKGKIYAAVYTKAEKTAIEKTAKTFGLDSAKYDAMDKNGRLDAIIDDIVTAHAAKVKELQDSFTGVDQNALKELDGKYQKMLDALKGEKDTALNELQKTNQDWESKFNSLKVGNMLEKKKAAFVASLKNPAFSQKHIDKLIEGELTKYGFDIEDAADGRTFVTVNGTKVQNPKKLSENLTVEDLFINIAEEFEFEKKSNGAGTDKVDLSGKLSEISSLDNMPAAYKEQQERQMAILEAYKK